MSLSPQQAAAEAIFDAYENRHTLTEAERLMKPAELAAARALAAAQTVGAEREAAEGWEWAVVEVFGHRRHAGRTREEERFGAKLLRVDVPNKGDSDAHGWTTHFYGGSAIFSFTLCDREAALKANKPWEPPARLALTNHRASDNVPDDDPMPF